MNILDASALLSTLSSLLPTEKQLQSPHDAISALLHTVLSTLGFRLIAIDDEAPSSHDLNNVLPQGWNAHGPGNYTFRYRHDQSSLEFTVKQTKLGPRTMINAIASETEKAFSLDISTADFTSTSFFPFNSDGKDSRPLVHGFISSNRVTDLVSQFQLKIVQNLIPGLQKEGYTERPERSDNNTSTSSQPQRNQPAQPMVPRPIPDHFPDSGDIPHFNNPLSVGRRDLDPFASAPHPLSPHGRLPDLSSGGMFMGPNDPIFGGRRGESFGRRGPWGGDGFLPPMGAPPGARFDPITPFGGGIGLPGRSGGGGGFSAPQRSGDPDNDELMPPGMSDMYS